MSIPGFESVFSSVGNLRYELELKLQGKGDKYEIDSLNRNVDSIESSVRSIQTTLDGLCYRIEILEAYKINQENLFIEKGTD